MAFDPLPIPEPTGGYDDRRLNLDARSRARFMASAYGLMASGVIISAAAAFLVTSNAVVGDLLFTREGPTLTGWAVTFAPLAIVFAFREVVSRLSADVARAVFLTYAALVGASLASILLYFTTISVGETLAGVAIGFAALAAMGAVTKTDLSRMQSFLTFTIVGLLAAMMLNLVVGSRDVDMGLSGLIVLFFSVVTLHDTQRLARIYEEEAGNRTPAKAAIVGALTLYLDLLNPFLAMVRIVGRKR
ncbi:MAG: Bax inhibitor-1/YccA family protein [Sphingomonas oligoaromativorans]